MGRRSRKRAHAADASPGRTSSADPTTRAERDAARRLRASAAEPAARSSTARRTGPAGERPPAPWGKFPLVELVVLLAIVMGVGGVVVGGDRGRVMLGAGVALGCLAGLELSIREHFAGYRSHTTLLAGTAAAATVTIVVLGAGGAPQGVLLLVAVLVFGVAFWSLREVFKRRSGGLGFR